MFDKETRALLSRFYKSGCLSLKEVGAFTGADEEKSPSPYISSLKKCGYITSWESDNPINELNDKEWLGFKITIGGRACVEQWRRDGRNFWVPYLITTLIAISSLIVSIVRP